jgi:hypothetical protein
LPWAGQDLRGPVDGIVGVEWEIAGTVNLNKQVQFGGTIILDVHGGYSLLNIGVGDFDSLETRQRSFAEKSEKQKLLDIRLE